MNRTAHRIRKRLFVSLVAVFLSSLVVVPSSPVMRHPGVRSSVETISSMNDESVEEDIEPQEETGRMEAIHAKESAVEA